jgi:glycolate oxidase iron-sulfur subunit
VNLPLVGSADLVSCIHCGVCLTACPTYAVTRNESDSPRGRIWFLRAAGEGRIGLTPGLKEHLDRCLTCYSCETACPSEVKYRRLIEDARAGLTAVAARRLPPGWRLFFRNVIPRPAALRLMLAPLWALGLAGLKDVAVAVFSRLPLGWVSRSTGFLPDRIPPPFTGHRRVVNPARGERRLRVAFMTGCVMEGFLPRLNTLYIAILQELGCEVIVPRRQGCCGALAIHEGERADAVGLARAMVRDLGTVEADFVVANSAGCGSAMKDYGRLLGPEGAEFASRVRDFTEVAASLIADRPPTHEVRIRAVYQHACHLGHAQRIQAEPRTLLAAVPGLQVTELPEQELCCGSAGVYNLLQPGLSGDLNRRKTALIMAAGVEAVVTANPGCYLQLAAGLRAHPAGVRLLHLAEVLARAYGIQ